MRPEPSQSITDHDLLVTLNTKFELFTNAYSEDMKDLKDGTTKTLADHEIRIKNVEQKQHDRETKEKLVWALLTFLGGIVAFLLNLVVKYFWPALG